MPFSQLVHNSFPFPGGTAQQLAAIRTVGLGLLQTRATHPNRTLAQLYDPDFMLPDILAAHGRLDRAVEAAFEPRRRLATDLERLEVLFDHYVERMREARADLIVADEADEDDDA